MEKREYVCPKCGNKKYEVDEIRTTGSFPAKIFDVQNKNLPLSLVLIVAIVNFTNAAPALSETLLTFLPINF